MNAELWKPGDLVKPRSGVYMWSRNSDDIDKDWALTDNDSFILLISQTEKKMSNYCYWIVLYRDKMYRMWSKFFKEKISQ